MGHSLGSGWLTTASDTPLNGQVGPNRRFGTLAIDLAEVKSIKNSLGGSVNDVVLAIVAGAVRRHLLDNHDTPVDGISFRVMAPVSVRSRDQRGTLGNQVAMWLVTMPIDQPDPVARLGCGAGRDRPPQVDRAGSRGGDHRPAQRRRPDDAGVARRPARLQRPTIQHDGHQCPRAAVPAVPPGGEDARHLPAGPVVAGHGAGIAIFSYAGTLYWGFNADWDVLADLDHFIQAVEDSYEELRSAAADAPPGCAPAKRRSTPMKRPAMGAKPASPATDGDVEPAPPPRRRPPVG